MLITEEIRWFFPGPIPQAVLAWFRDGAPIAPAAKRTDIYLPLPASLALSIKLRNGRLEIKTRSGVSQPVSYPNGASGETAIWKKEASRGELVSDIEQRLADPSALPVVKQRYIRKFILREGSPVEIAANEAPRQGCFFELTQLSLDDASSWTIALEAFGAPAPLPQNLSATAAHVFTPSPCPVPLTAKASASYPEWLPLQRQGGGVATAGSRRF